MKKIICLLLMFCMMFTVVCGIAEESAIDKLNDVEKQIYDALLIMLNDFYDPSSVRVMELSNYSNLSMFRESTDEQHKELAGPDTVVVRLSGANRLGGTLNNYYRLCLSDFTTPITESSRKMVDSLRAVGQSTLPYVGNIGDYVELKSSHFLVTNPHKNIGVSSIGNINRALKEYWYILGF